MRIEDDSKLDYKDVLIRPKRSTLGSRKDVELEREFTFRNFQADNDEHYRGIPIMASNMDGVGTFKMADTLAAIGLFTCLVKNYEVQELADFFGGGKIARRAHARFPLVGELALERAQALFYGVWQLDVLDSLASSASHRFTSVCICPPASSKHLPESPNGVGGRRVKHLSMAPAQLRPRRWLKPAWQCASIRSSSQSLSVLRPASLVIRTYGSAIPTPR